MPKYDFSQPIERKRSWKWDCESIVDGHRVLPMSVADTDFVSPREVTGMLREIVAGGEFGYCSYPDDQREVFAAWQRDQHGWRLNPEHVVISSGLLSSLVLMLDAVSAPGEGVIIFSPVYQEFFDIIRAGGRVPCCCNLVCDEDNNWQLNIAAFEALCQRPDTRAVLVCNPHNPVGRAWRAEELQSIVKIAQANDIVVFSDEIHADFVFDQPFRPMIDVAEDRHGIMALGSGGKTFNLGGLGSSYAMSEDERLRAMLQQALDRLRWHQDTFSAWGFYSAYKHGHEYRDEVVAYVRRMQIRLVDALNRMPFPVAAKLPEATYLLWVDFRATGWDPDQIHRFLIEEAGLGWIRGDAYGDNGAGFARVNCAVPESRIDEAIARLRAAFEKRFDGE